MPDAPHVPSVGSSRSNSHATRSRSANSRTRLSVEVGTSMWLTRLVTVRVQVPVAPQGRRARSAEPPRRRPDDVAVDGGPRVLRVRPGVVRVVHRRTRQPHPAAADLADHHVAHLEDRDRSPTPRAVPTGLSHRRLYFAARRARQSFIRIRNADASASLQREQRPTRASSRARVSSRAWASSLTVSGCSRTR